MVYKSLTDCITLKNGVKIPCVGFGTWQTADGDEARNAIKYALDAGYRHIDGAAVYGNERSIGEAVKAYGLPRDELFITSKLVNRVRGYDETKAALKKSLADLRLDYLDLYLVHWPNPIAFRDRWEYWNAESWRAFEDLCDEGLIRAIGVSNFHAHHLDALYKTARINPVINQIRLCPGETQPEVVKASRARDLLLEAYSPFGGSGPANVLKDPKIIKISEKYGKTAAQVCVRWCLQTDFLPLPKSADASRIAGNAKVFDFELDAGDMEILNNISGYKSPFPHPDNTSW
jgi:diketogulonate reductase-like aldo/keto reductase